MINGVNPNGDITQKQAKRSVGIPVSTPTNGINYANFVNLEASQRLEQYRQSMRLIDFTQGVNRFWWRKCPKGLKSYIIERVLYYRGQGMFYYDDTLKRYLFLPYTMTSEGNSTIDMYGQYQLVKPLPFNGKSENQKKSNKKDATSVYLGTITRIPVYDKDELLDWIEDKGLEWCKINLCVIIRDSTQQISEYSTPKAISQKSWIHAQAELPIFFRTALLKALTPKIMNISDQGVLDSVLAELRTIEASIIGGKTIIPVTSSLDISDIDSSTNVDRLIESVMKSYDSMDSIRKSHLGLNSNGAFQKQSGMKASEQLALGSINMVNLDGLFNRQESLELIKILFPDVEMTVENKIREDDDVLETNLLP